MKYITENSINFLSLPKRIFVYKVTKQLTYWRSWNTLQKWKTVEVKFLKWIERKRNTIGILITLIYETPNTTRILILCSVTK